MPLQRTFFSVLHCAILIFHLVTGSIISSGNNVRCESFDEEVCQDLLNNCTSTFTDDFEEEGSEGAKVEECGEREQPSFCYALWMNDSRGRITIKKKGCITDDPRCEGQSKCVSTVSNRNVYYCCCDGDLCNANFYYEPSFIEEEIGELEGVSVTESVPIVVHVLVIITTSALLLTFIYSFRKYRCPYFKRNLAYNEESQTDSSPTSEKLLPIELIEVKAKGRFGEVWKALNKNRNEYVAVKIVPEEDKQSWLQEQEVFKLPQMNHDNILQFIGAEKHDSHPKYWLITAYHERGSLCDYLKNNTVTWEELCLISYTMARGLAHLHDEIPSKLPECYKPAIAHRDFKSNNVLLKSDLTACIADFGLAIIFKNTQFDDSNHGQVGTRRYMAPEVLEGAISFSSVSFQRIDIYACGLVLWEVLSRCTVHEDATSKYKLPFEEELGDHPNIDEMLELVVYNRRRPELKESWRNHPLLSGICETIEECWDPEAEARISASCVMERFYWNLRSTIKADTKLLNNVL